MVDVNAQNTGSPDVRRYMPHPFYKLLAVLSLLLAAGMGWDLAQALSPGALLFLAVSLGIAAWSILAMCSRVEVAPASICLVTLLHGCRCVDFRQLSSVTEDGRVNPVITIIYHPQLENGLLDLDHVDTMHLPAVTDQAELLAHLQARMPI
jgi:hypothetical protein